MILAIDMTNLINFIETINLGILTNEWIALFAIIILAFLICREKDEKVIGLLPIMFLAHNLGFHVGVFAAIAIGLASIITLILKEGFTEYEHNALLNKDE